MTMKALALGAAFCIALAGTASAKVHHKYSARESAQQEKTETQQLNREQASNQVSPSGSMSTSMSANAGTPSSTATSPSSNAAAPAPAAEQSGATNNSTTAPE